MQHDYFYGSSINCWKVCIFRNTWLRRNIIWFFCGWFYSKTLQNAKDRKLLISGYSKRTVFSQVRIIFEPKYHLLIFRWFSAKNGQNAKDRKPSINGYSKRKSSWTRGAHFMHHAFFSYSVLFLEPKTKIYWISIKFQVFVYSCLSFMFWFYQHKRHNL